MTIDGLQVLEFAPDGVVVAGPEGRILWANRQLQHLFGYRVEELIGQAVEVLLPERYRQEHVGRRQSFYSSPGSRAMGSGQRVWAMRKDGTEFAAEIGLSSTDDGSVVCFVRDVTERRRLEDELVANHERFRLMMEAAAEAIIVFDGDGHCIEANPRFCELVGYPVDEVIGQPVASFIARDDLAAQPIRFPEMRSGQTIVSRRRALRKDGKEIAVEGSACMLADGVFQVILRDITERLESQQALRESEGRFRSLVQNATDLVTICEADGTVRYASPSVARLFGYCADDWEGRNILSFVHPDDFDVALAGFANALAGPGGHEPLELRIRHSDGTWRTVETRANNLLDDPAIRGIVHNSRDITEEVALRKEREESEQALRESEKRFVQAFRASPVALSIATFEEGILVDVNDAWLRLLGYSMEEAVGRTVVEAGMWPDMDRRNALVATLRTDGPVSDLERRYRTKSGEPRDVLTSWDIIDVGGSAHVLAMAVDITDRKRAEAARRASEEQYRSLFDNASDLVFTTDLDGNFVSANRAAERLLGYSAEDLTGVNIREVLGPDSLERLRDGLAAGIDSFENAVFDLDVIAKQGPVLRLEISTRLIQRNGNPVGLQGIARDVTQRRADETELKLAHEKTWKLLESVPSILIALDGESRVTLWNAAAESTFGIGFAEVLGHPLPVQTILRGPDALSEAIRSCCQTGSPERLHDVSFVRSDGREGLLGVTVSPIIAEMSGIASGVLLAAADITERRALEHQLVQAQKLESIGQLAAGIAHEINTPTQYVGDNLHFLDVAFRSTSRMCALYEDLLKTCREAGFADDLSRLISEASEEEDFGYLVNEIPGAIAQSLEGVRRVAQIVQAMKEFSHPGSDDKALIDLNKAIQSTIIVARNEWKYVAEVETDFAPDLPLVPCFPGDFNQVILNLLVNAAHAIAGVVGDGSRGKGRIGVGTRRVEEWAEIRVADTGMGIPEGIRSRVFDPFFTTKEVGRGTGQGLAISHGVIVKKHGGSISFETEEGSGTTFIIRIPLDQSPGEEV